MSQPDTDRSLSPVLHPTTIYTPSPTDDLVEIPSDRRHDSGTGASFLGIVLALVVTIIGAIGLGAGYGAIIALCSEKWFNITLAFSLAFWVNLPAQIGFMWGHVRDAKWRRPIGLLGFAICFYAICVGWVACVLDGPGIVLEPLRLAGHLADVSVHSFWIDSLGLEKDVKPLRPYSLTLRAVELIWILKVGLMTQGAETPYPYCRECRRWMQDETMIRLHYDPSSTQEAKTLAQDLVAGQYEPLIALDQPLEPKEKGLQLSVYRCEGNCGQHVLDATWHRRTPDPEKDEVERLLESGTGTKIVSGLKVPSEIQTHLANLADRKAA